VTLTWRTFGCCNSWSANRDRRRGPQQSARRWPLGIQRWPGGANGYGPDGAAGGAKGTAPSQARFGWRCRRNGRGCSEAGLHYTCGSVRAGLSKPEGRPSYDGRPRVVERRRSKEKVCRSNLITQSYDLGGAGFGGSAEKSCRSAGGCVVQRLGGGQVVHGLPVGRGLGDARLGGRKKKAPETGNRPIEPVADSGGRVILHAWVGFQGRHGKTRSVAGGEVFQLNSGPPALKLSVGQKPVFIGSWSLAGLVGSTKGSLGAQPRAGHGRRPQFAPAGWLARSAGSSRRPRSKWEDKWCGLGERPHDVGGSTETGSKPRRRRTDTRRWPS